MIETIRCIAPLLANAMSLKFPTNLLKTAYEQFPQNIEKCLVYAPDALGLHLLPPLENEFASLNKRASFTLDLLAEFPSITPVCFASMFTGLSPKEHGITKYKKPVLQCSTLFDWLIATNKKTAIITVQNSSIDKLYKKRDLDYFSLKNDQEVTEKTLEVLQNYDFVLSYHQDYDDALHDTTPFSTKSILAAKEHLETIQIFEKAIQKSWSHQNYLMAITPDHGAHICPNTGKGDHGDDCLEDRNVRHYFFTNNSN